MYVCICKYYVKKTNKNPPPRSYIERMSLPKNVIPDFGITPAWCRYQD